MTVLLQTGKTSREWGVLRREDPMYVEFIERGLAERYRVPEE